MDTRSNAPTTRLASVLATVTTTLRSLTGQSRRLATTSLAVLLGVAFTAGTLVLTDTLRTSFDAMHVDANAGVDLAVRRAPSFGSDADAMRDRVADDVATSIATVDGVSAVAGRTTGWAQLTSPDGTLLGDIGAGVDPIGESWIADPALTPWRLVDGAAPSRPGDVVVDRVAATSLDLSAGDTVDVLAIGGTTTMTVSGIAAFGDDDARFGSVTVFFGTEDAQRMLGAPGRHDLVIVSVAEDASRDDVAAHLTAVVGDEHEVVTGSQLAADARAVHQQDWGFFDTFMKGFAVVALAVGGFIIFNTFSITVAQRTREFAVLRAIGAGRGQVLGSVLTESVIVGMLASAAGLLGGVGVSMGLHRLFGVFGIDLPDGGLVVRSTSLGLAFVVGVTITALSALLPAIRAGRTAPVAAMRDTAVETSGSDGWVGSRARIVAGSLVTAAGVTVMGAGLAGVGDSPTGLVGLGGLAVFAGVTAVGPVLARPFGRLLGRPIAAIRGVPGQLAGDNASRSPKRTAATAAALMIGVSLVGFITIVAASVKASIDAMVTDGVTADIVVDSGSFGIGGFDRSLVADLSDLPEVGLVTGTSLASGLVDGDVVELWGVDTTVVDRLFDLGRIDGSLAGPDGRGLGTGSMAVNADTVDAHGWTVGTAVDVTLADGVERVLTIDAVIDDPHIGISWMVDTALLEAAGQQPFDVQVFVDLDDDVSLEAGLAAVDSVAGRLPNASVLDRAAFAADRGALVDPLLGVVYALLAFAVLIATLGIVNTLALSIMERTRELGVLRAVGASRTQVRTAVRWESVMIAAFGTTLGLVIGTGFGWAVVRSLEPEGITRLAFPITSLAVIGVLAACTGVVAAVLPARRAARLDVLEALRS